MCTRRITSEVGPAKSEIRRLPIGVTLEAAMISAYEHGRTAAQHGKHIQACPFDTGSPEWREWRKGFCDEPVTSPKR